MKIKPVLKYQCILPAAAALLGSLASGCDRQGVVGSVPNPNAQQEEGDKATTEKPAADSPKVQPRLISGMISPIPANPPAEKKSEPEEEPQLLGGDVPYTPDME